MSLIANNISFVEIKDPLSGEYQQSMFWCQHYFNLSIPEIMDISSKLKESGNMHFLVVKNQEKVIGCSVFYYLSDVQMGYLEYIFVRPEFKGQGIGTNLYKETLATLEKHYPDVRGMILEVQNTDMDMGERKEFFLNQGALPVDLHFYPVSEAIKQSGILLMYQPLKVGVKLTTPLINGVFTDLTRVVLH